MKRYEKEAMKEALDHAEGGGQALHVWVPTAGERMRQGVPGCFVRSLAWAHLFDLDTDRLINTARELGVQNVVVHHRGSPRQHVDLCGAPLKKAFERCREC